ncbi:MAG: DUF2911 domain-containing protein [Gemmatimonadales bacterium]
MMSRVETLGTLAVVVGLSACASEPASNERTFVETLGNDTIAVESFTRTGSSIDGQVVSRNPATTLASYHAELGDDGRISRFEANWHRGDDLDGPAASVTVTREGDAVQIVRTSPEEGTDTLTVEPEALLVPNVGRLPLAVGMIDYATRRAVAEDAERLEIAMLTPSSGRLSDNAFELRAEGVYTLGYFGSPQIINVDETGAVQSVSGRETTGKVEIAPAAEPLDVAALAADYAARDASGAGLGVPSPTDTVTATIGGAEMQVVYSRPAMRGRDIWGGLVPYGEVWRTGANAATDFTTSRPIRVGDLDLPAGEYTLWTTFTPEGGTLIVNSQTGQWGTAYDAEQDFGRTAFEQRPTDEPVERFTIELDPDASELRLVWADRMYVAPIAVR